MMRVRASHGLPLPHAILAAWFGLAGAQLLMNALLPPLVTTPTATLLTLSALALLLCLTTLLVGLTRDSETMLLVLILTAEGMTGGVLVVVAGGQSQIMACFYLLVLGLIAGLGLSRARVAIALASGVAVLFAGTFVNPLLDTPGYAIFAAVVVALVTLVVHRLVNSLREQALHDQLTGALNRRGLEQAAELAHGLATREGRETTVVEIDLDGFKAYNDEFGHAAGDDRLAQLVSDWRQVLRRTDLLARIGGDEFVVVLPGASAEEAVELVSRMRSVNDVPWTAGVSTWFANESLAAALARADRLMYGHKRSRSGRETVN